MLKITRCKGKDNFVMLDGIRTTQEILTRFYKDVHAFICSYYPNYFRSMDLAKQRELLLRILPAVSSEDAFKLLEKEEQEILEHPIADIKGFCKSKRAEIKEITSELDKLTGSKNMLINIAIQKEDNLKKFEKQSLSQDDKTAVLIHELCHCLYDDFVYKTDRNKSEIFIESVAFLVADYFNFDTSLCSFGYIINWAHNDIKEFMNLSNKIKETADEF